jgi:protein gp37
MGGKTGIEWCDATWNPVVGCSVVSPGCTNCYAMRDAYRKGFNRKTPAYHGLTKSVNGNPIWNGKVALASEATLVAPLKRRKPTAYFVNSMGDLFHEAVPDEWIDRVFAVMALSPQQHTFIVLTKRAKRMRNYFDGEAFGGPQARIHDWCYRPERYFSPAKDPTVGKLEKWPDRWKGWPLPNVVLGVSAEDQARADERIPDLLATPAAKRIVSAEPLLGPIDFTRGTYNPGGDFPLLDGVILGGESGPGARPMHPDWARSIRNQCAAASVPFFFKQWGEWTPGENVEARGTLDVAYFHVDDTWSFRRMTERESQETHRDDEPTLYRVGKRRAGRLLDGVEHNDLPWSVA